MSAKERNLERVKQIRAILETMEYEQHGEQGVLFAFLQVTNPGEIGFTVMGGLEGCPDCCVPYMLDEITKQTPGFVGSMSKAIIMATERMAANAVDTLKVKRDQHN